MPSIFDSYRDVTGKELPDPVHLAPNEKMVLAYFLTENGESKVAVARFFNVSRQTIYDWRARILQEEIMELECKTQLELFAEELCNLKNTRDEIKKQANKLKNSDSKTENNRGYAEMLRALHNYDKLIIELYTKTGLIATNDSFAPDSTIKSRSGEDSANAELDELNSEELTNRLVGLLTKKTPCLLRTPLKDAKDNLVI